MKLPVLIVVALMATSPVLAQTTAPGSGAATTATSRSTTADDGFDWGWLGLLGLIGLAGLTGRRNDTTTVRR